MKTVRVGLAYYNGSKYIDEQINSILEQDLDRSKYNLEIKVYNDNSDEVNTKYIDELASKHEEISVVRHNPGKGVGRTFMTMLFDAHEEDIDFIFWCDQDDFWYKDKASKQVALLENNIASTHLSAKWNGTELITSPKPRKQWWHGHVMAYNIKELFSKMNISRENFFKAFEVNEKLFAVTYHDFFMKVVFLAHRIEFAHINEVLVGHRVHEGSLTNTKQYEFVVDRIKNNNAYIRYYDFYKEAIPMATGQKITVNDYNKMYYYSDPKPALGWMRWKYNNFLMRLRLKKLYILPDVISIRKNKKKYK